MSWIFSTEGHDGEDYAGVVLCFCGGRLRVPLILYGCPYNDCAKAHDAAYDSIDWAAGENSVSADNAFRTCCIAEAHREADGNPAYLNHMLWFANALYCIVRQWGNMRSKLTKYHLNW